MPMMLEVINGFLLVYFFILCIISALVPHIINPIATCFNRPSNDERKLWEEIVTLRSEQKAISMKDEFAAYSKLQRKINKLENEFKNNSQSRRNKTLAIKSSLQIVVHAVVAFVIVISVIWFRREPIVALKGNLFPFTSMLKYPSDTPNTISSHIWVLISNISVRSLLKPIL